MRMATALTLVSYAAPRPTLKHLSDADGEVFEASVAQARQLIAAEP